MVSRFSVFWLSCGLVTFLFVLCSFGVLCCRHLMPTQRAWCCTSLLKSIRRPVHLSCYHSCWRLLSLKTSSVSSSFRGGEVHLSFKEKSSRDNLFSEGFRIDGFDIPITRDAEKLTTVYLRDFRTRSLVTMSMSSLVPMAMS